MLNLVNDIEKTVMKDIRGWKKKRRFNKELKRAIVYEIVETIMYSENAVFRIKEKMRESISVAKIFEVNEESIINRITPELMMYKFKDVEINVKADWILHGNEAIYDKYFMQQFEITIPVDYGVLKVDSGKLYLRKEIFENEIIEVETGYTLGGVQCDHWGHFSLQYLPKLGEIPRILQMLDGEKLTVILPCYADKQIKYVVYNYLADFKDVDILEVKTNAVIKCKELFYMEKASFIMEHSRFASRAAWNLTSYSANALKKIFFTDLEKYDEGKPDKKLYLDRKLGMHRRLTNGDEVRKFFEKEGFIAIEDAGSMLFEEKVRLFRNASYLVGPEGTAFMNVIFCRPNTKILKFASFVTADCEGMTGFYDKYWNLKTVIVCAFNDGKGDVHGDFSIPLERIQRAYDEFNS